MRIWPYSRDKSAHLAGQAVLNFAQVWRLSRVALHLLYRESLHVRESWLETIPFLREAEPCSPHQSQRISCRLTSCLAATWQQERCHITVIGARNVDEVTRLVARFERHRRL